ncbi:MAG: sulfatase [Thermoanaerobaculia bacterium]
MTKLRYLPGLAVCALALAACVRPAERLPIPSPSRGYVLISLDALRPDHLGAYGYQRPTSPFLDTLAARGAVFERAVAQYPSTLASHLTIFTGLYPQEHAVFRPERFLDEGIETLPERLLARGFRTAGFTEGGFMTGAYGFERGFEHFDDRRYREDTDVERTFDHGLRFLDSVEDDERFFLFLHTYSIHDPYTPPERYRGLFWEGEPPPGSFDSDGQNLRAVNRGELAVTPEIVDYFASQYDASIRYVDDVLAGFWARVEELGLADEITLVVTSDHGEAFYEHGTLAHFQVYPEDLMVPLIVVHPGLAQGVRVPALVSLVDLAPSLYELMAVEPPPILSGRSLAPYLLSPEVRLGEEAYGEALNRYTLRTLLREQDGTVYQIVLIEPEAGRHGIWITRSVTFQPGTDQLDFEAYSFHEPRTLKVLTGGEEVASVLLGTGGQQVSVKLPPGPPLREVVLSTPDCVSPLELGMSDDARCLSFQVRGLPLRRSELYDLGADPGAKTDISKEQPDLHRMMLRKLLGYRFEPVTETLSHEMSDETRKTLRDLGYLR